MGYVVLHIEKAAGTDAAMSGHVERRITPANVITTLTYLNEELVEFPKGVTNRTEAIQHRLDNAGLERKIGKNQVRALRVMLSGSPAHPAGRTVGCLGQGFLRLAAKDLRKGKRCVGSPASGRENTTYTRDRRADHTGRTQKGQAGAGEERPKRKENLSH